MTKASDNIFPKVTLVEGAAPSSPAANDFHLFFDSADHLLKWKNSAGTVTTIATGTSLADPMTTRGDIIVRNSSNATARLAVGSANKFLHTDGTDPAWAAVLPADLDVTADNTTSDATTGHHGLLPKLGGGTTNFLRADGSWNAPTGSSGAEWNQVVSQAGTTFTGFTAATGTWSSNGTEIIQTDTTATWRRAKYDTLVALGFPWIIEAEMFHVSVAGSERRAGIGITDGTNINGLTAQVKVGTGVIVDQDNTQTFRTLSTTINDSTWYKLRLVMGNAWLSIYLDGTLLANTPLMKYNAWDDNAEFVSLVSYNSSVKFRNLKTWVLSTNAPA